MQGRERPGFAAILGEGQVGAVAVRMLVVAAGDYSVSRVAEGDGENTGRFRAVEDGSGEDLPGFAAVWGVEDARSFAAAAEPDV